MSIPEEILPLNDSERIANLKKYEILDTPPDGSFDQFTKLAAKLLDVPIAIVSLVDKDRIWFKSKHGLDVKEIGRDPGLCASAILSDDLYLVEDARNDIRTLANPLVAGDFGLQFYAAVPLKTREGFNLGTFCVIDQKPRTLSEEHKEVLKTLGELVMHQMQLRLEARTALRHQHHILSVAAHDLKNPLTIMPLLAEMITQNKDNPEAIEGMANKIKEAGSRMTKIVNNLLDAAREETGKIHLRLKSINLEELIKGVVESNNPLAKKKDQILEFHIIDSCTVYADPIRLSEIFDNLINNAIKYSPPSKKIDIFLKTTKRCAVIAVRDEGPGLTKDDKRNLFRKFTSLSAKPTGGETSSGLGLSIVKSLVMAHKGKNLC